MKIWNSNPGWASTIPGQLGRRGSREKTATVRSSSAAHDDQSDFVGPHDGRPSSATIQTRQRQRSWRARIDLFRRPRARDWPSEQFPPREGAAPSRFLKWEGNLDYAYVYT